jgi:peptide/nickel transport system substrate-binding protein
MRHVRSLATACVAATVLTGCGGGDGDGGGGGGGSAEVVSGGTFTLALDSDPGNLDPQASVANNLLQVSQFAYDPLLYQNDEGELVSGLASAWERDAQSVRLTMQEGITCSDGSPFTAEDAAANINHVADPANESPLLGIYLPPGASASADGDTVTIALAEPAPFVLEGLASLPMVCGPAIDDRSVLAGGTLGTGPYELTEVVASDHLTYTKRDGYTWGPDGASTATEGLPDEIVAKIVSNETTAANLLLSGGLNAAKVVGQDAQRLDQEDLFSASASAVLGEMWFNQAADRPGADPAVRQALTQALDLEQVTTVLGSGRATAATQLAANSPTACSGSSVEGAFPGQDLDAAGKALDDAGWTAGSGGTRSKDGNPLAVTLLYGTTLGAGASPAAELMSAAWQELGVDVTVTAQDNTAVVGTLFGGGDWDVTLTPVNVSSPDQIVPFLSGPVVPDGNNFASIDNADYTAGVAEAATTNGAEGCDQWLDAEKALYRDFDVVPFANSQLAIYGAGAEFAIVGFVQPTSIRMLAN